MSTASGIPKHAGVVTVDEKQLVTKDLHEELQKSSEVTVAVAVIRTLTRAIERSTATTVMGLEKDLNMATEELKKVNE